MEELTVRLAAAEPYDRASQWGFLARHVIAGVDAAWADEDGVLHYCCAVRTSHGQGVVRASFAAELTARVVLTAPRDLGQVTEALGRLLDLPADPLAIDAVLATDARIAASVAAHPGMRLPGAIEITDLCLRTVIGQQVSIAAANTTTSRLTQAVGEPLVDGLVRTAAAWGCVLSHLPLSPGQVAGLDPESLAMPRSKARALVAVAQALASGEVALDPADPIGSRRDLEQVRGIGPWTSGYVAIRGLGARDIELACDLIINRQRERLALTDASWARPYRSHLMLHLWSLSGIGG